MAGKDAASRLRDAAPVTPENRGTATATVSVEQSLPEGVELLDPTTSARRYWRDPQTGTQREIWRPGDADGDVVHDHYDRRGPLAPLEQRWRFYQSPGPFKSRITEPPSNVILDDRAVYDILESNIPRAQLSKRWSHDFSGQANVRHRRPHRGRPAYKDENAVSEKDKYQSFRPTGKATPLYFFLGEKDFEPVYYQELPEQPEQPSESSDSDDTPKKPKQHNQYTAPELLVRNGAESKSLTKGKYRQRVNTFLRRSPTPPWVKDRKKLFGGVGIGRSGEDAAGNAAKFDFSFAAAPAPDLAATVPSGESMWVDQDDEDELEESEDELVMTSVFDKTPSQRPTAARFSDGEEADADGASTALQKRKASTGFASARHKAPKQMGYIERLAAGLLEEDAETAVAAPEYSHNADVTPSSDRDRIAQLECDLQAATTALTEKNAEIAELKSVLEGISAQM